MEEIKKHEPRTFSWIDLATTDLEAAKTFYTKLFGLTAVDTPAGPGTVYTMLNLNDKPVAAIFAITKEQLEDDMRPHWDSYVTVDDVEETVSKVKFLGGSAPQLPFEVSDAGRLGIVRDPTGAILALWQPNQEIGARYKNIPGSLCWNELVTSDAERSKYFFTHLLGWKSHTTEMPNITYTTFLVDDKPVAGMYQMPDTIEDVPSHWLPYFAVEDCDLSCAKAQELGAVVLKAPTDIPGTGRYAVLQDPQGAAFAILKMEPMEEQPE